MPGELRPTPTGATVRAKVDTGRRAVARVVDRALVAATRRPNCGAMVSTGPGPIRLSIVVVNFSTTTHLKLLLGSLTEQTMWSRVEHLVIVDQRSRDGGAAFLQRLAATAPTIELVERRRWLHHAAGLRAGIARLDELDGGPPTWADVVLCCDPDVVFVEPDALARLIEAFESTDAALVGEPRRLDAGDPDMQASFFAVRRPVLHRPDIAPIVHGGSPAQALQRSIAAAPDLIVTDLGNYRDRLVVHRGRSGVEAAHQFEPWHPYASVATRDAHFMGVPGAAEAGRAQRERWGLLDTDAGERLLIEAWRTGRPVPPVHLGDPAPDAAEPVAPPAPDLPVRWADDIAQRHSFGRFAIAPAEGPVLWVEGTGAALWPLFETPTTIDEASRAVADAFALDLGQAVEDVNRFVSDLMRAGVLVVAGPGTP